jgi:hypothetical protein
VYDLEVEGEHEFFANGILVHNCQVYARVGLSRFIESRASLILPGSSFAFTGLDVSEDGKRAFLPKV